MKKKLVNYLLFLKIKTILKLNFLVEIDASISSYSDNSEENEDGEVKEKKPKIKLTQGNLFFISFGRKKIN